MPAPSTQAIRRIIMTGSVAAITATGVWYGAGLKTKQEYKQERRTLLEAPPAERIQQLEAVRGQLVKRKEDLEEKIQELSAKQEGSNGQTENKQTG